MSADLLRRAAAKLRLYVSHASRGPWNAHDDGLVWADRLGDPVSGSVELEDAEYIALMHPPVALALADWLEAEDAATDIVINAQAAALARAVLREPRDGA